jgi:hypothetical protein
MMTEDNMEDTWYRVFYDYDNTPHYTNRFPTIEEARNLAQYMKQNTNNINLKIVEEVTTRRVVEVA